MAKKDKKGKKPASKPAKKANKPTAKKAAKPAAKKVAKPAAKKSAKPAAKKTTKPTAKKAAKPANAAKSSKPAKSVKPAKATKAAKATKPINEVKAISKSKPETKPTKASKKADIKPGKIKAADGDEEELEVEDGILEGGLEVDGEIDVDDDADDLIDEAPKKRGRGKKPEEKRSFDSEEFVRKQVVKIDLNKSLIKKQKAEQPKPFVNTKDNRSRYSDEELQEFKEIILKKLEEAKVDYELLKQTLSNSDNHGTDDTSPTFKLLEDGSDVLSKEETAQLAARQEKYIIALQNALIRIENKSYGICRVTGKLIPKERLRSVPHATLGIDAKLTQYD